ncbi:RING finger protein 212B-like [Belonocnema kinseyi]|uniref:RING finger protein 212B-like n=1 Tax=Belonocnema kinseyi TaxID=2817044 RepID=UPI00143D810A|nr:RING finger protein 212B-like [Belonocnema kinseyi]
MESKDDAPKNWLRCNLCFCLMCKSKDPFSLMFCDHIFCKNCIGKARKQCPQCKTENAPSMVLQEPLKPKIKHCFESKEQLSEKLRQATLFHEMQRALNCKRLNVLEKKYALVKREYYRKAKEVEILKEKYENLLKIDQNLHKHVEEFESKKTSHSQKTSFMTPISSVSSIIGSSQSISSCSSVRTRSQSSIPEHLLQASSKSCKKSQICLNLQKVFKCQKYFEKSSNLLQLHSQLQLNLNYKTTHYMA